MRLTDALRFTNNDKIVRDIPAGVQAKIVPEDVIRQSSPYGGALADLLVPYLAQANSTLFAGKPDEARSVLPPPLVREGERVQPKWLYQFLLNPGTVRPPEKMKLRMPKFNMSPEDAMTLVNYFGARRQAQQPGRRLHHAVPGHRAERAEYWHDRNEEYLKRPEGRAAPMKPEASGRDRGQGAARPVAGQAGRRREGGRRTPKGDELTKKQKEIDDLKAIRSRG